eukprot:CAMPEP_0119427400 /NCGR_PEP_ID=MMETSP1335-20130426/38237_1 /TAXON_ID=259385 /ORGANISM="Chrysoculter rhomboideus, Strain RCC1486" /LENGTH=166 /DNA_ID=CAMNT_0007453031 /DNA_START=54 /DNA_END=551 /DNA_ORIENTATION=+
MALSTSKASADMANKNLKRLEVLMKLPDNQMCADCPIKGPRWASINLGIFVCMPCAGIHRNLGVHISKMKSVNLDKWNGDWVDNMEKWGNIRANAVWQANVPSGYRLPTEKDAADQTHVLETFIRDKYERQMFKLRDDQPPPQQAQRPPPQQQERRAEPPRQPAPA